MLSSCHVIIAEISTLTWELCFYCNTMVKWISSGHVVQVGALKLLVCNYNLNEDVDALQVEIS